MRHLQFGTLERLLPPTGTEDAELMAHLLRCEFCTEAALTLLELSGPSKGGEHDYDEVFARVAEEARRTLLALTERREKAYSLVEVIAGLAGEAERVAHVRSCAREEPWGVTMALLDVGREVGRTDPERAAELARWAAVAAEAMEPSRWREKCGLLARAECLLADAFRKAGRHALADEAFARAAARLEELAAPRRGSEGGVSEGVRESLRTPTADVDQLGPLSPGRGGGGLLRGEQPIAELHAAYCLLVSRLRRDQGRMDEAVALLHRAKTLYDVAGDVVEAEAALEEAEALDPIAGDIESDGDSRHNDTSAGREKEAGKK